MERLNQDTDIIALPRRFQLQGGDGTISEEASHDGDATGLQSSSLEIDDGALSLRFCHYSHRGRFSRSPRIVADPDFEGLRQAL